jgi:uncharacterized protein
MSRPVHFEITADDPARAVQFYESAFGWKIHQMESGIRYWLVDTGEGDRGINGAIADRQLPGERTINTIGVASLEAAVEAVKKAGGTVTGKIDDIPNVGRFTYAFDTEGNAFGILEPLPGM